MTVFPDLSKLVQPRNLVVVGGSQKPNSEGARLLNNLAASNLGGEVFVVNPKMTGEEKQRCWPSVSSIPPVAIDVALVLVRAALVPGILRECANRNIPFAIVMSSGFDEAGPEGQALGAEIRALCATAGLRVYGPNCPGLTNIRDRVGMTFSPAYKTDIHCGRVGLVTQGGGAGRNVLQGLAFGAVGVGLWLSGGNEIDLGSAEFIAHMANDPDIDVITVVLEGIKHGKRLAAALELARERGKPVVILKVGRSEYGAKAAASHTGSIAGAAHVNRAVFRQFGAIEVDDIDELVAVTRLIASPARPTSSAVAVITFSGGAGAMAADHTGLQGLQLANLAPDTVSRLRACLPHFASTSNPVDVTADALKNPDSTSACLRAIADDPGVGAIVIPIPADYAAITDSLSQVVADVALEIAKPILPVWMSRRLGPGFELMEQRGLGPFTSLSSALSALRKAVGSGDPVAASVEREGATDPSQDCAADRLFASGEAAAKQMLSRAGIPVPEGILAKTPEEAADAAEKLGFPVVMKVASEQILHKTEVNGVRLSILSTQQATSTFRDIVGTVGILRPEARIDGVLVEKMFDERGREMLVGIHTDEVFGRVITVGLGGIFVELLKDVSHRMLPISEGDAKQMLGELRHAAWLNEFRNRPAADIEALEALLVRISSFAMEHTEIEEAEFNPVWVGPKGEGAYALDALILSTTPPTFSQ
ncbi:acetate--CoA ligase family protein [Variovorax robiniae]|uniref:Acetate--CoA ligase family protein n=1 Tax=Variovorax robiniae TaxID=1836199 RepID=A0ABU8XG43_9BURK